MNYLVPEKERTQKILASCLALTAGYLDGYGLLMLGTYVSFMSGNTTMAGLGVGQLNLPAALPPGVAVVFFVAGSFLGNLVIHFRALHPQRVLFGFIAVLLIVAWKLSDEAMFKTGTIAVLSLGMGMLNPALSHIGGEAITLTFVTGTLSRIGNHLALAVRKAPVPDPEASWDTHLYRARVGAQVWASFIIGAVLAGVVLSISKHYALAPGVAVMIVLALVSSAKTSARRTTSA